jgi:hypothetical protein
MGYQAYIPVDIMSFGVRVIFDENGKYTMRPAEGLELVFPATDEGYVQTHYKIALRIEGEWYESVSPAKMNDATGMACVNRIPRKMSLRMTGLFNDEEVTLCNGVISTMLEKTPESQYVSFQTNEFQMGVDIRSALKGNTYGLPDDDSAIVLSWGTTDSSAGTLLNILTSFTQKGMEMLNGVAVVTLPEQKAFIDNIIDLGKRHALPDALAHRVQARHIDPGAFPDLLNLFFILDQLMTRDLMTLIPDHTDLLVKRQMT